MSQKNAATGELTIDELAAATGTSTRSVRSFQTMGLLDRPALRGRTGIYSASHAERLRAIFRLQAKGFSLESLGVLFRAHERGETLDSVLGFDDETPSAELDAADLYAFVDLQSQGQVRRSPPFLSIVPTTVFDQTVAS
jgi:DNA-binding transcriptional MerR regulator